MMIAEEKKRLRQQKKAVRAALTPDAHEARSHTLCERLAQAPLVREAPRIYCYAPLEKEVDLWALYDRLWQQGKALAFPRVLPSEKNEAVMAFFEVKSRAELQSGAFGVKEPVDDGRKPVAWSGAPVLVPGVAFASDGSRCGYGKGYYDRYLAAHPEHVCIGVAFDCQMTDTLPALCEPTDRKMDEVQTEYRCYAAVDAMDAETLIGRICGSRRFGSAPGIVSAGAVCELLGNPQDSLRFVHIAGTNGKGSTAAFLAEICARAGVRAGVFTSPHLEHFSERIRIGAQRISEEDLLRLGRVVCRAEQRLFAAQGMRLTMFDHCLAIALLYFQEQQAELVILETGMGGRLDATNLIAAPLVSVITAIGLEHTQYLGDTIQQIAAEKAGILKSGTQAVLMEQSSEVLDVLTARCAALGIPYQVSGAVDADGSYEGMHWTIGMHGDYQRKNAAAAITAAKLLAQTFPKLTPQAIWAGVQHARWPGRMELVSEQPWVLLDGAHNVAGVTALAESLRMWNGTRERKKYVFFMGVMAEKDYEAMVELILPLAIHIYALTPDDARALSARALCACIRQKGGCADVCADNEELLRLVRDVYPEEKCVIFGSLYLIGAVRKWWRSIERKEQEEKKL